MKKIVVVLIILLASGLTIYGAANLILEHRQSEQVTVGDVESEHYALIVEELNKETGTLIYDHEYEYDNNKRELTYTYQVKLLDIELPNEYTLSVTGETDDVVIKSFDAINLTTTFQEVNVTFGLNQDKTYTKDQILDIVFIFGLEVADNYNVYTFNDTKITESTFYSTTTYYTNNGIEFEIFQANNNYGDDGIMISGQNGGYMEFDLEDVNELEITWAAHEMMDAQIIIEVDGVIIHEEIAETKEPITTVLTDLGITSSRVRLYAEKGYYPIITEMKTK